MIIEIFKGGVKMTIDNAIKKLVAKEILTEDDVRDVINQIMRGEATSAQIGGFLVGLRVNGETPSQILGAVKALRDNFIPVKIENPKHLIDTCGTGGDGAKTFNISTAVAIVAASGGAKVAKHGNRAVSSKSGSADVLTELGIKIDFDENQSRKIIEENGLVDHQKIIEVTKKISQKIFSNYGFAFHQPFLVL